MSDDFRGENNTTLAMLRSAGVVTKISGPQ